MFDIGDTTFKNRYILKVENKILRMFLILNSSNDVKIYFTFNFNGISTPGFTLCHEFAILRRRCAFSMSIKLKMLILVINKIMACKEN